LSRNGRRFLEIRDWRLEIQLICNLHSLISNLPMYDQIARFYDLTHAGLTADIDTILALAGQQGGPILELGCGSGRLLLPLARAGYAVTGVDNSVEMLARARRHLDAEPEAVQAQVTLVEADMESFKLAGHEGRFTLAIIAYNTLMHLATSEVKATFKRAARYLRAGGRLFLDLSNPLAVAQTPDDRSLTLERALPDPETGEIILQLSSNHLDEAAQTLYITWIYDVSPAAGGPVQRTVARAAYRYFYPHQLELLLAESGFRLESLAGDYGQAPLAEDSPRLLVTAVKGE